MVIFWTVLVVLCLPLPAFAWGPGTHLKYAEVVLANAQLLPAAVAALLQEFPTYFSYGNIIADLILGKHFGIDYEEHSHNWQVAIDLHERVPSDQLRAVMLGYQCHLAADVIAHNIFVPTKIAASASGIGRGHAYWEMRFDAFAPDAVVKKAHEIAALGQGHIDAFLMDNLTETLFSHNNNRRIFDVMMWVQRTRGYRRFSIGASATSRFAIHPERVAYYDDLVLRCIWDFLQHGPTATVVKADPVGRWALEHAGMLRKHWRTERREQRRGRQPVPLPPPDREAIRVRFLDKLLALPDHPFDGAGWLVGQSSP